MSTYLKGHGLGTTVLRVSLGIVFAAHALLKLLVFTLPGTAAFFEQVGFPGFMAYPVFAVELMGGLLLAAGLWTRWAALALVPVMIGATTVHWANGWAFTSPNGGWEFPAFLAAAAFSLFLDGRDGAFAVSALIRREGLAAERRTDAATRAAA
jgi:putative oxidoreductase